MCRLCVKDVLRGFVVEYCLIIDDFIYFVFVLFGENVWEVVFFMFGVERFFIDLLV